MQPKSIFQSKTFWLNAVAGLIQFLPGIADQIPQPWGGLVLALANIGLRFITTQPVKVP